MQHMRLRKNVVARVMERRGDGYAFAFLRPGGRPTETNIEATLQAVGYRKYPEYYVKGFRRAFAAAEKVRDETAARLVVHQENLKKALSELKRCQYLVDKVQLSVTCASEEMREAAFSLARNANPERVICLTDGRKFDVGVVGHVMTLMATPASPAPPASVKEVKAKTKAKAKAKRRTRK